MHEGSSLVILITHNYAEILQDTLSYEFLLEVFSEVMWENKSMYVSNIVRHIWPSVKATNHILR